MSDDVRDILNANIEQNAALDELLRIAGLQLGVMIEIRDLLKENQSKEVVVSEIVDVGERRFVHYWVSGGIGETQLQSHPTSLAEIGDPVLRKNLSQLALHMNYEISSFYDYWKRIK